MSKNIGKRRRLTPLLFRSENLLDEILLFFHGDDLCRLALGHPEELESIARQFDMLLVSTHSETIVSGFKDNVFFASTKHFKINPNIEGHYRDGFNETEVISMQHMGWKLTRDNVKVKLFSYMFQTRGLVICALSKEGMFICTNEDMFIPHLQRCLSVKEKRIEKVFKVDDRKQILLLSRGNELIVIGDFDFYNLFDDGQIYALEYPQKIDIATVIYFVMDTVIAVRLTDERIHTMSVDSIPFIKNGKVIEVEEYHCGFSRAIYSTKIIYA